MAEYRRRFRRLRRRDLKPDTYVLFQEINFQCEFPEIPENFPIPSLQCNSFESDGFHISDQGIEAVPANLRKSFSQLCGCNLDVKLLDSVRNVYSLESETNAVDIGCSSMRLVFDSRNQRYHTLQSFYHSNVAGRGKCVSLLKTLLTLQGCNFLLGLEGALFDPALNRLVVVTEPAMHGNLRNIVCRCGALPAPIVSSILRKLLDCLNCLQKDSGLVHNGLTSCNIFLDADGHIRMGGLQLAVKNREVISASDPELCVATYGGDLSFVSPERFFGQECSYSSDIWSVGIVAYELFFNRHIFHDTVKILTHDWNAGIDRLREEFSSFGLSPQSKVSGVDSNTKLKESTLCSKDVQAEAEKFISSCLKLSPEDRSTLAELRHSHFIRRFEKLDDDVLKSWLKDPATNLPPYIYIRKRDLRIQSRIQEQNEHLSNEFDKWKDQRVLIDRSAPRANTKNYC